MREGMFHGGFWIYDEISRIFIPEQMRDTEGWGRVFLLFR